MEVRTATPDDAAACAAIYAPYVTDTVISFELEPPSASEMAVRIARGPRVAGRRGRGRASSATPTRACSRRAPRTSGPPRSACTWRWAAGAPAPAARLYSELLPRLAARGFRQAIAGMTLPNDASEGLHRALGFELVGVYRRIGWKFGAWHDVAWTQLELGDGPPGELA